MITLSFPFETVDEDAVVWKFLVLGWEKKLAIDDLSEFFSFGLAISFLSFNLFDELPVSTVIFLLEAGEAGVVVDKEGESELVRSWDFELEGRGSLATGSAAIEVSETRFGVDGGSRD